MLNKHHTVEDYPVAYGTLDQVLLFSPTLLILSEK